MRILLTGANGYIGKRLLPQLLELGHYVICCVRDKSRFRQIPNTEIIEVDFLNEIDENKIPEDTDAAYYLIHSMASNVGSFEEMEKHSAENFIKFIKDSGAKQIIYLSGISNEKKLSRHLSSRKRTEEVLKQSGIPLTVLRAGIILGSGSASFEIIRDLVEKLPVMITPKWLNTKHQPVAIRNVLQYLTGVILNEKTYNRDFDIGGPDILTYKQMLLKFAEVRGLKRYIITLPVMTPKLSSYWLYFVTSTSYKLAVNLVNSMKVEIIARDFNNPELQNMLGITPISYKDAVKMAFTKIEQNEVVSSWKDSLASGSKGIILSSCISVPVEGCFIDKREKEIQTSPELVLEKIWSLGGKHGWYYANFLWKIRGFLDKLVGGVGLRHGRTNQNIINPGDALDYWRVLAADKKDMRLLLYAEMKLPGEAWLEFKIVKKNKESKLVQTATFRPKGLAGRLYWYFVWPFHFFVFNGMAKRLTEKSSIEIDPIH
ncbi:MAG: SDR family oxidoreductase [Ignavibacteriae bacterium]|nr:MAG: SDR family oxidoreductase [Ignavibacteriota bacterium]